MIANTETVSSRRDRCDTRGPDLQLLALKTSLVECDHVFWRADRLDVVTGRQDVPPIGTQNTQVVGDFGSDMVRRTEG